MMRKCLAVDIAKQLSKAYYNSFNRSRDVPDVGNVSFVTGDLKMDSFIFYAEQEYGIEARMYKKSPSTTGWKYTIVNEEKYIMFVLKWS